MAHPSSSSWLDATLHARGAPKGSTLVLCRTRATVALVRRWLARQGGQLGIEVATPAALATLVARGVRASADSEHAELPAGASIAARIQGRPGLIALARRWVHAYRLARIAGHDLSGAPSWLRELDQLGFAPEDETRQREELLTGARARGLSLGPSFSWERVVPLGFDLPPEQLDPWTRALLEAWQVPTTPQPATPVGIPAVEVPDTAAEARVAADLARGRRDVLVLLSEETTARRLRDALRRNGVGCAWRENGPLAAHAVASALTRSIDWFSPSRTTDPMIRVTDLAFVLGQTALGQQLHPAAERWVTRHQPDAGSRLGRRAVDEVLREARLLDAPLSRWIARLESLRAVPVERRDTRFVARVIGVEARLRVLAATILGERVGATLGDEDDAPVDDFDRTVAELLGSNEEGGPPAAPHTLGAVKAFLLACRVRFQGDAAVQAILGRLTEREAWPATAAHLREALSGAPDPSMIAEGVDLVHVDDYDGRPCGLLIVVDVHDKGIARRPSPDPLLTETEIAALGQMPGSTRIRSRIGQVHRAVAAAAQAIAVVTQRDAGGRDVVAPVHLELIPNDRPVSSYGLHVPLPEHDTIRALTRRHDPALALPRGEDPVLTHLAIQATAEWVREGRAPRQASSAPPADPSLPARLRAVRPIAPDWLLPWLGHAEGVAEAALPSGREWSYSRLFRPLTHCLYQAWGKVVLDIREAQRLSEALDPREIGEAVHDALERIGPEACWRTRDDADRDAAVVDLVGVLDQATDRVFADAVTRFGDLSASRRAAVDGQVARWKVHWRAWAGDRVRRAPAFVADTEVDRALEGHPLLGAAQRALTRLGPEPAPSPWLLERWLCWAARQVARGQDLRTWDRAHLLRRDEPRGGLPEAWADAARQFLDHPTLGALGRLVSALSVRSWVLANELAATATEVPFGEREEGFGILRAGDRRQTIHLGPAQLPLGEAPLSVRGRIDRVAVARGPRGPLLHVTDYKTGRQVPDPRAAGRDLWSLREPQLIAYALALRAWVRAGQGVPPELEGATVAAVGWDYLRQTPDRRDPDRKVKRLDAFLVDDAGLDAAAEDLGWLVDEGRAGRWTLAPRPDTCPALNRWSHDHCSLVGACRLRRSEGT